MRGEQTPAVQELSRFGGVEERAIPARVAAWTSRTWAFDNANFLPPLRPRARAAVSPARVSSRIKHVLGFRRFSLRGLAKVRGEWDLLCLAVNVKRLHVLMAA